MHITDTPKVENYKIKSRKSQDKKPKIESLKGSLPENWKAKNPKSLKKESKRTIE